MKKTSLQKILLSAAAVFFALAIIFPFLPSGRAGAKAAAENLFDFDTAYFATTPDPAKISYGLDEPDPVHGSVYKIEVLKFRAMIDVLFPIDFSQGETYTISYWLKTSDKISSYLRFMPTIHNGSGETITADNSSALMGHTKIEKDAVTEWKKFTVEYTAVQPSSDDYISFKLFNGSNVGDVIYISDVQVIKQAGGLLNNGNFTKGTSDWDGISSDEIVSDAGARSGNALEVVKDAACARTVSHAPETEEIVNGKKYTLSMRYRNDALFSTDIGAVYFNNAAGNKIAATEIKLLATNSVWQQASVDFTAGSSFNGMQFMIDLKGEEKITYVFSEITLKEYQEDPVVINGDFSDGLDGWRADHYGDATGEVEVVDDATYGKALKISKSSQGETAQKRVTDVFMTLTGPLQVGRSYIFSVKVKNQSSGACASHMNITRPDGSGAIITFTASETGGNWKEYSYKFTVTEGYEKAKIYLRANNQVVAGQWVDSVHYFADLKVTVTDEIANTMILNGSFSSFTANYPDYWGVLGGSVSSVSGGVNVSKTAEQLSAGLSTQSYAYGNYRHKLTFDISANAAVRENLKIRITPYADKQRTPLDGGMPFYGTVNFSDTENWQPAEVEFDVPAGANSIDVSFFVQSTAAMEFNIRNINLSLSDARAELNFDFELGSYAWNSGAGAMVKDGDTYDGSKSPNSVKIDNVQNGLITSAEFAVEGNSDYELSFWVKSDVGYDAVVLPVIQQKTAAGTPAYSTVYHHLPPYTQQSDTISFPWLYWVYGSTVTAENPDGWVNVRANFRTAEDAAMAVLRFSISGIDGEGHAVWFDDVNITRKAFSPNYDFENTDALGNPDGWYLTGARDTHPQLKIVDDVYHSGGHSMYIKTDTVVNEQHVIGANQVPITATGDKRIYEVSFWVASRNSSFKSIQLDLWNFDENHNKIYSSSVGLTAASNRGVVISLNSGPEISRWEKVIARVSIAKSAKYVSFVFTLNDGAAEIWVDDIYFNQVEDDNFTIADHGDFRSKDHNGKIAGWDVVDENMNVIRDGIEQKTDPVYGAYGHMESGKTFMRYRCYTTATSYEYTLAVRYRSNSNVGVQLRFNDYLDNEYQNLRVEKVISATAGGWVTEEIVFIAPSATTVDFMFGTDAAALDILDFVLYQSSAPKTRMSWTGQWICYKPDFRWCDEYAYSYYRKTITLEDKPVYAPLQLTADDKVALYVNGEFILSTFDNPAEGWESVQVVNIEDYLKAGENVIAVHVYNQGAYSAMIFDGIWTMPDGSRVQCYSDADTKCLGTEVESYQPSESAPVPEWVKNDFDDSSWSRSSILGPVPMNPWGDVYFNASLYIDNNIEIEVAEGEGKTVNDLNFEFSVKIKLEEKITTQLPLSFVIWRKNSTKSLCSVTPEILSNGDMTEWTAGEWEEVKMLVELPDYIDSGNYTLQLADDYFFIKTASVFDNKFIDFKVVNDFVPTELVSKVEDVNGVPAITINGEPVPSIFFTAPGLNLSSSLGTIGKSGIELYVNYNTNLEDMYHENGSVDYDYFDKEINTILSASTYANLVVTFGMEAPGWWLAKHPDECVQTSDQNGNVIFTDGHNASMGSVLWQEESGEILKLLIAHMRRQNYYSRIAGIRFIFGHTAEFITYGSMDTGRLPDYSPAALEYFKGWAERTYGTIENLREAWNEPELQSFDDIAFPTYKELMQGSDDFSVIYDPVSQRKFIDFRNLLGEMTSDCLLYWAKIAKEATDYKLIVGAYFGYLFMGGSYGAAGVEHTALDKVLKSDLVDFFASPGGYNEKQLGESIYLQAVSDSIRAHGKLVIAEQDNRTVLTGLFAGSVWDTYRDFQVGTTHTMDESILQEKRDMVFNLVNGNAQWLYDMYGGWINDDQIYEFTNDANDEFNFFNYIEKDVLNDVAVILPDKNSTYYRVGDELTPDSAFYHQVVLSQYMYKYHRKNLDKMGTSYDVYALSTLTSGKMPEHKVNIFFSPYVLTSEERAAIDAHCKKNGQINIFLHLSGAGDENGLSAENMKRLTGFDIAVNNNQSSGQIKITDNNSKITQGLAGQVFGAQVSTIKYFTNEIYLASTDGATVLGEFADSGKPAFAVKDMGGWTSIFCAAPLLTTDIYRNILKTASVHVYSEDKSDIVIANSAYVGVHSATEGYKSIKLDGNYAVYDVFEKKYVSLDTDVIEYYNRANDTHLFRLTQVNTYSLLAMVKGGHGTVSLDGLEQVSAGSDREIVITPDAGYMVKSVVINGEEVTLGDDNTLSFDNIDENNTIVVRFKRLPAEIDEEKTIYGEVYVPTWVVWTAGIALAAGITALVVLVKKKFGR